MSRNRVVDPGVKPLSSLAWKIWIRKLRWSIACRTSSIAMRASHTSQRLLTLMTAGPHALRKRLSACSYVLPPYLRLPPRFPSPPPHPALAHRSLARIPQLDKYQEQPQILDADLDSMLESLFARVWKITAATQQSLDDAKAAAAAEAAELGPAAAGLFPFQVVRNDVLTSLLKVAYTLAKVRGYKVVRQLLPKEVMPLPLNGRASFQSPQMSPRLTSLWRRPMFRLCCNSCAPTFATAHRGRTSNLWIRARAAGVALIMRSRAASANSHL